MNGTQLDYPGIIDNVTELSSYLWRTSWRQCLQAVYDSIAAQTDGAERVPEFVRLPESGMLTVPRSVLASISIK